MFVELGLNEDFVELYKTFYNEDIYKTLGIDYSDLNIMNFRRDFIYKGADLASISVDANANVNQKSFIQYKEEYSKPIAKLITLNTLYNCLEEYYDTETADLCVSKLLTGELFLNDATSFDMPYCYAFDLDKVASEGFQSAYFKIKPPKRATSFCNIVIQLLAEFSNHLLGAVAFPNFFLLLDWYLRKEYGEDYTQHLEIGLDEIPDIKQLFQHLVFSFNWNYRGSQTAFLNLSILDYGFLHKIFGEYVYPDLSKPNFNSVRSLSMRFFEYFTSIYGVEGMFTYPVCTLGISKNEEGEFIDRDFVDWVSESNSEKSIGNCLVSPANVFASCCRLKNGIDRMSNGIQNSFGVSSVSIGSHRVAGINLPRVMQFPFSRLEEDLECVHKILLTHRRFLKNHIANGLLPLYAKGYMFLNKQYSTIGFLGLYEGLKAQGLDITTEEGLEVAERILKTMDDFALKCTQEDNEKYEASYNLEEIPAESMAVRLAKIDTVLGFNKEGVELYSNQYIPLTLDCPLYKKLEIQGKLDEYSSGGSILHITHYENRPIPKSLYRKILETCRTLGVSYFAFNYAYSTCKQGHSVLGINEGNCPVCGSENDGIFSRVVGFITKVTTWNLPRRKEFKERKSTVKDYIGE